MKHCVVAAIFIHLSNRTSCGEMHHRGNGGRDSESNNETRSLLQPLSRTATVRACCHRQHQFLCVRSKPAFIVVVWKFFEAAVFSPKVVAHILVLLLYGGLPELSHFVVIVLASYAILALLTLFFPLAGFIADVYVGRFKTLFTSLWFICTASLVMSAGATVASYLTKTDTQLVEGITIPFIVLGSIFGLVMAVGLAGFKANAVQFGTDQMLEAPGEELSFFIHWYVWADYVGNGLSEISFTFYSCSPTTVLAIISFLPFLITLGLMSVLCYSCSVYTLFMTIPANHNPYKMVLQVLNFARNHKHPIQRSAMTYCDNKPYTRIDLGKQKYGGPFTTEQVEDVKTLLRILCVLLTACSVFVIEIPAMYSIPLLAKHIHPNSTFQCNANTVLLGSGILSTMVAIVLLPIYIRLVHPYFRRYTPGILKRLGLGMIMLWMSVVCNFVIDTVGHEMHPNVSCMFQIDHPSNSTDDITHSNLTNHEANTLHMDTTVLLIPNILNGIAYTFIKVAMFEFICAQSPHSMKGLLMGLFFALRGLFELLGAVFVVPFSFGPWENLSPTLPSCGFYYYLLSVVFGFAGIVSYVVTARRYTYRQRDEVSNERIYIEDYYAEQEICNSSS